MQTANAGVSGQPRHRARRRPRPITIVLSALIGLLSLGAVLIAVFALWPPDMRVNLWPPGIARVTKPPIAIPTPRSPHAVGLKVEKAGEPRRDGDQWIVPVRVTNMVQQSPPVSGTPTPNAPTSLPEPAKVYYAPINVIFYGPNNEVVGGGNGQVLDLAPGQSKTVEVVATAVGDFTRYEVYADTPWTDKDPLVSPTGSPIPPTPNP